MVRSLVGVTEADLGIFQLEETDTHTQSKSSKTMIGGKVLVGRKNFGKGGLIEGVGADLKLAIMSEI